MSIKKVSIMPEYSILLYESARRSMLSQRRRDAEVGWKIISYSTRFNLGLGVMPGILPRLAIGLPAISWRSAVKSIGLAPLI